MATKSKTKKKKEIRIEKCIKISFRPSQPVEDITLFQIDSYSSYQWGNGPILLDRHTESQIN
jgi:hypothetical protein